jgi:hypothetical protein
MKNWTNKKRIAFKSAVGALAKLVRRSVRHSGRRPLPANGEAAPPPPARQESSGNIRQHRPATPRKSIHRAGLAVEDGFKEF